MRINKDKTYRNPEDCTRFSSCNVNNCPLHPNYPNLSMLEHEKPCPMPKSMRMKFSKDNPGKFKYGGLTVREYGAMRRWKAKSPKERKVFLETLAKAREAKKRLHSTTV